MCAHAAWEWAWWWVRLLKGGCCMVGSLPRRMLVGHMYLLEGKGFLASSSASEKEREGGAAADMVAYGGMCTYKEIPLCQRKGGAVADNIMAALEACAL